MFTMATLPPLDSLVRVHFSTPSPSPAPPPAPDNNVSSLCVLSPDPILLQNQSSVQTPSSPIVLRPSLLSFPVISSSVTYTKECHLAGTCSSDQEIWFVENVNRHISDKCLYIKVDVLKTLFRSLSPKNRKIIKA